MTADIIADISKLRFRVDHAQQEVRMLEERLEMLAAVALAKGLPQHRIVSASLIHGERLEELNSLYGQALALVQTSNPYDQVSPDST